MLQDVNRSLKEFLIYGLKSEDNLASLNSHFDEITKILIQSTESETRNGSDEPEKESKEERGASHRSASPPSRPLC